MRALLVVILLAACAKSPAPPPAPAAVEVPAGPRVVFPNGFVVRVEVVADDEMRAQGLMYRDRLPDGTGMLFLFPEDGEYPFWMKNTMIPLDILWIDAAKKVVAIKENVPPCKVENCPNFAPNAISRYVLEVNGGVSSEKGLKVGDVVRIEGIDAIVPR